jgi:hypothetical protein
MLVELNDLSVNGAACALYHDGSGYIVVMYASDSREKAVTIPEGFVAVYESIFNMKRSLHEAFSGGTFAGYITRDSFMESLQLTYNGM